MELADRASRLGTETAFEVLAAAKALEAQGRDVVHLEIGEPDFDTPRNVVEAAIEALNSGYHHYVPAAGMSELRDVVALEVSRTRGISVDADNVVITPGGKPIIFFSLLALAQRGDEVIYPNPGFPIYESMINYVGATPVPIPLREDLDFRMDVEELIAKSNSRTKLIILNSPNNPTGSVLTAEDMELLAEAFADTDVVLLSDEIYSRILYEGEHLSPSSWPGMQEHTIILDGFSKTYAMTGWRLGYGVMNRNLVEQITRLMVNSNSCTAAFTQMAGVEALTGDQSASRAIVKAFRERRGRVVELLNAIDGISCRTPGGAFYVFPNIKELGISSGEFQDLLLNEYGVALLSGTAFGRYGQGYIRLSYAAAMDKLEKGIGRIAEAAATLRTASV